MGARIQDLKRKVNLKTTQPQTVELRMSLEMAPPSVGATLKWELQNLGVPVSLTLPQGYTCAFGALWR